MTDNLRLVRQAASWCLRYPDETTASALPIVADAVAELGGAPGAKNLRVFLAFAQQQSALDLAAHYVTVFDLRNRRSLNVTWWSDGDTRRRGMALLEFKQAYQQAGWEFAGEDLPDFLPAVLEFAALDDPAAREAGERLLAEHHSSVEALHKALIAAKTPYGEVLAAVRATAPPARPGRRPEPERPLLELVGLDAYPARIVEAAR
jgi:nitrate reductase molybdenum cofactor assembly chaperone NarJ/NarW